MSLLKKFKAVFVTPTGTEKRCDSRVAERSESSNKKRLEYGGSESEDDSSSASASAIESASARRTLAVKSKPRNKESRGGGGQYKTHGTHKSPRLPPTNVVLHRLDHVFKAIDWDSPTLHQDVFRSLETHVGVKLTPSLRVFVRDQMAKVGQDSIDIYTMIRKRHSAKRRCESQVGQGRPFKKPKADVGSADSPIDIDSDDDSDNDGDSDNDQPVARKPKARVQEAVARAAPPPKNKQKARRRDAPERPIAPVVLRATDARGRFLFTNDEKAAILEGAARITGPTGGVTRGEAIKRLMSPRLDGLEKEQIREKIHSLNRAKATMDGR